MSNGSISHRIKIFLAITLIIIQVVLLCFLYFSRLPNYPVGWDAPYYISQTRYLLASGNFAGRIGTTTLLAALNFISGISLIQLANILPIVFMIFFALISAFFAYITVNKSISLLMLIFSIVLWYPNNFYLSVSTFDNSLALIFLVCSMCGLLLAEKNKWWLVFFSVSLLALSVAHLETFVFLIFIYFIFLFIEIIALRSLKIFYLKYKYSILLILISSVLALIKWSNIILKTFSSYYSNQGSSQNASIPYAQGKNFTEFIQYAKSGLTETPILAVFLIAVLFILIFQFKKRFINSKMNLLLSYVTGSYLILLFSVFRGTIPINRSVLLLPLPLIIGIGIYILVNWQKKVRIFTTPIYILIVLFFIILPILDFNSILAKVTASIPQSSFDGLTSLNKYVINQNIPYYYIVTNTRQDFLAASAYYGLWNNWIQSILPLSGSQNGYCMYFGSLENFVQNEPTFRANNQEYNDTSIYSTRCLNTIPSNAPIFIIKSLYPGKYPPESGLFSVVSINENVVRILPFDKTSVSE